MRRGRRRWWSGGVGLYAGALLVHLGWLLASEHLQGAHGGQRGEDCEGMEYDEAMARGVRFTKNGDYVRAKTCLKVAYSRNPRNAATAFYLGEAYLNTNEADRAEKVLEKAVKAERSNLMGQLLLASCKQRLGKKVEALAAYEAGLLLDKHNIAALVNGGIVLKDLGRREEAVAKLNAAIRVKPDVPEAHYNLADVLYSMGDVAGARKAVKEARRSGKLLTQAYTLEILMLEEQGNNEEALRVCREAVKRTGDRFSFLYQQGRVLRTLGRFLEAEESFRKCVEEEETRKNVAAHRVAYAHNEYGHLLSQLGRKEEALKQWERSVEVDPSFAQGWVNMVSGDLSKTNMQETISMYKKALELKPDLVEAWINLGQTYYNNFRSDPRFMPQALASYRRALEVAPDSSSALYSYVRTCVDLCRWEDWDENFDKVAQRMKRDMREGTLLSSSISLVYLLVYPIPDHVLCSAYAARAAQVQLTAEGILRAVGREGGREKGKGQRQEDAVRKRRITVGYVSADFRQHPVSLLFQNVPGLHDSARFRVVCFSLLEEEEEDAIKHKIRSTSDSFIDISNLPHELAFRRIEEEDVSVLVDMNGYTQHGRPELFALFPDKLRISFLGFASSLMGTAIQYITTDKISSPPDLGHLYTEKMIYFPHTFYLADHPNSWHTRALVPPGELPAYGKHQVGLDPGMFVFACFNQPFKISPRIFAVWMRILKRVPRSQIWILKLNEGTSAEPQLKAEARRQGIDEGRLFFTGSADLKDHVAYKSAADLLLDTDLYNAHSTAADALFAGVPLITLPGTRMSSRIGASIANGLGHASVMVARDLKDYEEIAVRLARSEYLMTRLKRKVAEDRVGSALYDAARWVNAWETTLLMIEDMKESVGSTYHLVVQ